LRVRTPHKPPVDAALERAQRAVVQATRALAGARNLEVTFGPPQPSTAQGPVRLPSFRLPLNAGEAARVRGHGDHAALRHAYHDAALHDRFRPSGTRAREIYDTLEDVRCQSLGARALPGVAANLAAVLEETLARKPGVASHGMKPAPRVQALALLLREHLTGLPSPAGATELMLQWRKDLGRSAGPHFAALAACADDQRRFAFELHELVRDLDLGHELGVAGERQRAALARRLDTGLAPDASSRTATEGSLVEQAAVPLEQDAPDVGSGQQVGSRYRQGDETERQAEQEPRGSRLQRESIHDDSDHPNRHYKVFTRAHDEVVDAHVLCADHELTRLRADLDRESRALQPSVTRLAVRLERLLLARQTRRWQFDLEEGALDAARLARVVTDPLAPLAFREETKADFKDTVVSLLLDNSGSMRGRPIMVAALCADVLARTLERCAVQVEILGFTTREWSGGRSREDWLAAGRPAGPGRLSDVRYLVYKPAEVPYRRTRRNLGAMLREDLLKDNIDGEALLWAHERLLRRPEQRRILMVISDGVPLDEATLSANPGGYLEHHLRNVVKWIETRSGVELVAIGIGHDVTDFYERAVAIPTVDELGNAMIEQLADLFAEEPKQRRARGAGRKGRPARRRHP
jgi:cobaltochelatase CobT